MPGEQTREICQEVLGLSADETDRLIADGVLFTRSREPMMDPRTPVLIGYGQVNQHDENPEVEPVDLMVSAARAAADPRVLEAVDSVRVVNLLSWRYRDPGLLLAQRIRADGRRAPATRASAEMSRSRWSTRRAWTSRPAAQTSC